MSSRATRQSIGPEGLRFADLFHGNDERIPIDGLKWGTETLAEIVTRFAGMS